MTGKRILTESCRRYLVGACFASTLTVITATAFAQLPTAAILGTIQDTSGAVVPGANVTARNIETGQVRSAISAADGSYRFPALPVGSYEVRLEHSGFQTAVRSGLTLAVGQEAVVNFTLELGAVGQTISVTAEAPLVNTTSGSVGGLVDAQKVADLPLNGRDYATLTLLQTGVTQFNVNRSSPGGTQALGVWFSSNGAPPRSNNFLLDGALMQTANDTGASSVSQLALGVDGIREFRVITNSFSAEYGMRMGSQVVMVTKGGTNAIHGSLFEYLRNSALDARNFFDYITPTTPRRLPSFTRNNFGGSFGGPIKQDRTFFFGVYEELRERLGKTLVLDTIPESARVDGGLVPEIAPIIKPLLALYPLPNLLPNNQFTYPFRQPTADHFGQIRIDHTFSASDNFFVRYTIDDGEGTITEYFPPFKDSRTNRFQYGTLAESHIFSPTLLNTFRFSYSRTNIAGDSPSGIRGQEYTFVPGEEIGAVSVGGVTQLGGSVTTPSVSKQNVFTWSDDLFWTHGRHSLKFGTLINRYQYYKKTGSLSRGLIQFANLTSFLLGRASSVRAATLGSVLDRTYHYMTAGVYAQDDFRATSRLTLNLGLRYEFNTQPQEVTGRGSALRDVIHDAEFTLGPPIANPSLKSFSPRFGFAWDITGNGKTALRGGFGLLYDISNLGSSLGVTITASPPFSSSSLLANPPTFTFPLVFPASAVGKTVRVVEYNEQQPHMLQYNLTLERELPLQMALRLTYGGSRGINIPQITEGNVTVPSILPDGRKYWLGNEPRMNPNWDSIDFRPNAGDSLYNSLQVGLVKRMSRGLQFQSSYTWSKTVDTTQAQRSGEATSAVPDPANLRRERAPTDFDVTQNWRFNTIYRFPEMASGGGFVRTLLGGWWMSGIVSLQTGYPLNPRLGTNRSRSKVGGGGGGLDRPDLVTGRNTDNITSGQTAGCLGVAGGREIAAPDFYLDPCAFTVPEAGFLGTAARNSVRGPGSVTLDYSLVKDTSLGLLGESGKLEFRAEVFNLLNRVNFGDPNMTIFAARADTEAPLSNAGRISTTATPSRQIQLALKLLF